MVDEYSIHQPDNLGNVVVGTRVDPDQTDEYNNSLVFGNDSSRLAETQNHGNILDNVMVRDNDQETQADAKSLDNDNDGNTNGSDGKVANVPTAGGYQYAFTRNNVREWEDTQVINGHSKPEINGVNVGDDTQVIQKANDTQIIANNIGQQGPILQEQLENTQQDSTIYDTGQHNDVTTLAHHGGSQFGANGDLTQVIQNNVTQFTQADSQMADKSHDSSLHNHTLGIVLTPGSSSPKYTLNLSKDGNTNEDIMGPPSQTRSQRTNSQALTNSPHTQFDFTKSFVEIPGTVERDGITTQVPNTQEHNGESSEFDSRRDDDEASIHTDDEAFGPMCDDSVLNHKLKVRDVSKFAADPDSPSKNPVQSAKRDDNSRDIEQESLANDQEIISFPLNKRRRFNVIESQSDGSPLSTPQNGSNVSAQVSPISQSSIQILREETSNTLNDSAVISKASVFANHKFRMYTGVVNNVGKDHLEILFEEGAYDIDNNDLYPLDLRIGDAVKIKGSSVPYTVTGLSYENSQTGIRCIRGYNRVYLKKQRKSRKAVAEELDVSISEIFMELTDWYLHQQTFKLDLKQSLWDDTLTSIITENIRTPTRNRHTQDFTRNDSSKSPIKARISEGVLSNSLFCITSVDEETKQELVKLIYAHGGSLIEEGFMELFTYRKSHRLELAFKHKESSEFNFVALLSNDISRSSKYLQTVSLGWPVLSEKFVYDISKDSSTFNNWPAYLLAAGKSSVIESIKSLDVFKFRLNFEKGRDLSSQINNNGHLLEGFTIVGLDNITNNKEIITCEFILYAFGATNFVVKPSIKELTEFIKQADSDKVLIYDNSKSINKPIKEAKVINWEWVVQCCISNRIWKDSDM